jgi:apolipoprotein N-acyltransferase
MTAPTPTAEPADKPAATATVWRPPAALAGRPAYALATLSGFLYFLAFPGIDVWPLSLVAFVPLLVALRRQTPRRAAGLGWMAGFTMTMTGFYWLLDMLQVFSGFHVALCLVFMVILCAYQGGRIALMGWLHGRAAARGWPAPLVFLLAFAASELVYPLLFPWYYGATVHNAPALMQAADLGGPILVGLLLLGGNLAIAELVEARLERRSIDRRLVATGLAAPLVSALYGAGRMRSVDAIAAASEPVRIGIAQGNMPLFGRKQSLVVHKELTADLKPRGVDLVVWSEAAVTNMFLEATYETEVPKVVTGDLGVAAIVGGVLRRPGVKGPEGGKARGTYFNTALLADPSGKILGRYDKQFLLAFGEYIPFGETFPVLYDWSPNSGRFTPGTSIEPMVWGEHKISALICYEDILPTFVNGIVRHADPDLLVNLTNDAWFGDTTEPWIHFALAKLRAVEHRRYLVRATNSGVSGVIDPVGRVVVHGGTFRPEGLVGDARWMRATTGYELAGDVPWWLATIAVVGMGLVTRPKRRREDEPAA